MLKCLLLANRTKEGTEILSDRKYNVTKIIEGKGKMFCACEKKENPSGAQGIFYWNMTQGLDMDWM